MHSPITDEYYKAAISEVETLEVMNAQEVVDCTEDMNAFQSTWAFKLKRFPDGLIKKFKPGFVPGNISRSKALIS